MADLNSLKISSQAAFFLLKFVVFSPSIIFLLCHPIFYTQEKEYPEKLQAIDLLKREILMLTEEFSEHMSELDITVERAQGEYIYDAHLQGEEVKKIVSRVSIKRENSTLCVSLF